jgi:AsmA family protein
MAARWHSVPRPVRIAGVGIAVLVVLLLLLPLYNWSILRRPLERIASSHLHRAVQIGRFSAHLVPWGPTVTIGDLTIPNADWAAKHGPLAQIGGITAVIDSAPLFRGRLVFSRLQITDPRIDLERDGTNRANWYISTPNQPKPPTPTGAPPALPAVHLFTMSGGRIHVSDAARKLTFDGTVAANENSAHPEREPLRVEGHGELNGEAFRLTFGGSALFNLALDKPYNFDATVGAGTLEVSARGELDRPFNFAHFGAALDVKGENLAGLYYLTGLALPHTPPFHFSGNLRNDNSHYTFKQLEATVGHSDLHGEAGIDAAGTRPRLTASLISHALDLADLAPSLGAGVVDAPKGASSASSSGDSSLKAPNARQAGHLLPTHQFDFDRMRKMDANVELRAEAVKTQKIPIQAVDIKLSLVDGVLRLDPLDFTLPQGQLSGSIKLDARSASAQTAMDLRLREVVLQALLAAKQQGAPPYPAMPSTAPPAISGTLDSRVQLSGHGSSVHEVLASANGELSAVLPEGDIRKAFSQLAGINVARGLGLLLSGSQQDDPIRCGIMAFKVDDGVGRVQQILFDTSTVLITGSGDIDFGSERLDVSLQGHAKKFSLFHLYAPVRLAGTFSKPSLGIGAEKLALQGGIAAALGVVATPLASLIAFVDPGLAKDQNCAALLATPQAQSTEHPGPAQRNPQVPAPSSLPAPVKPAPASH